MIIDFHTHLFPDFLAPKALGNLTQVLLENGGNLPQTAGILAQTQQELGENQLCYTDGTASGTIKKLDEWGVDKAVVLNIATNPKQQHNVNQFALSLLEPSAGQGRLIPFGSVHPESKTALNDIEVLAKAGIKGMKFHPEYQHFFANDPQMNPFYDLCAQLGLVVVFHAGFDAYSPELVHCTPAMGLEVKRRFPKLQIVMAHFGGMFCWQEVLDQLAGEDIWLDTAYCYSLLPRELALQIVKKHGSEHILFASDAPWQSSAHSMEMVESWGLTSWEQDRIFYHNAQELLRL